MKIDPRARPLPVARGGVYDLDPGERFYARARERAVELLELSPGSGDSLLRVVRLASAAPSPTPLAAAPTQLLALRGDRRAAARWLTPNNAERTEKPAIRALDHGRRGEAACSQVDSRS